MEGIFEGYSDTFEVVSNPYGVVINYNLSAPNARSDSSTVARIRTSWEMTKVLAYLMMRVIKTRESKAAVSYPIPLEVLNSLSIAKEDWDKLWSSPKLDFGEDK